MTIDWPFAESALRLGGADKPRIEPNDAARQIQTATDILQSFVDRPGVLLSDEVGMGKTYVATASAGFKSSWVRNSSSMREPAKSSHPESHFPKNWHGS
jgi:hypothetical protein